MANWEQLTCPTCGSNAVEFVNGFLCCKYCKSKHTLEEKISEAEVIAINNATMDRQLRRFDEAQEKYDLILAEYPDSDAANWGAFLCSYGISYEKDYDETLKPTCHRLNEIPVEKSPYYAKLSLDYKKRANEIETLRIRILEEVKKIQPYDVFICYKQNEEGKENAPTRESKWARDTYDMLTQELGLRVFYAEKSLAGSNVDYEPHIYAALRSAKLMVVETTSVEHLNSVWVANEWKRYTKYIQEGEDKTIRVVYDTIEPSYLPKALNAKQAISHDSRDWIENLKKSAEEIFDKVPEIQRKEYERITYTRKQVAQTQVEKRTLQKFERTAVPASEAIKLKRAEEMMDLRKFDAAKNTLNSVLEANRACSRAYFDLFLSELGCANVAEFEKSKARVKSFVNFEAAIASGNQTESTGYLKALANRIKADPQAYLFEEFIALPNVTQKQVEDVAMALYDIAVKFKREDLFDSAIKVITDTDLYIECNCEFGKCIFTKLGAGAEKYFDAVLAVDEGHQESLLYKYMIEVRARDEKEFSQYCIGLTDYTRLEKIYSYGYFVRLSDMLFTEATNTIRNAKHANNIANALRLADFMLQITPKDKNELFLKRMERVKDALFAAEAYEYLDKYLEQLLALDPDNDYTYFERLLAKHKTNDYVGLVLLGDKLLNEPDFDNACNKRDENEPTAHTNFYMLAFRQYEYLANCVKENHVDLTDFVKRNGLKSLPTLEHFVEDKYAKGKILNSVKTFKAKVMEEERFRRETEAARQQAERNRRLAEEKRRAQIAAQEANKKEIKGKSILAWVLNIAHLLLFIIVSLGLKTAAGNAWESGSSTVLEDGWAANLVRNRWEFANGFNWLLLLADILINVLFFTCVRKDGNMDDFKFHIVVRVIVQIATVLIHILSFTEGDIAGFAFGAEAVENGELFGELMTSVGYGSVRLYVWMGLPVLLFVLAFYAFIFGTCCDWECGSCCGECGEKFDEKRDDCSDKCCSCFDKS